MIPFKKIERVPEWHDVRHGNDTIAKRQAHAQRNRDEMVYIARLKILESQINQCVNTYQGNYQEICRPLVMEYHFISNALDVLQKKNESLKLENTQLLDQLSYLKEEERKEKKNETLNSIMTTTINNNNSSYIMIMKLFNLLEKEANTTIEIIYLYQDKLYIYHLHMVWNYIVQIYLSLIMQY